jgi:uncharacterized ferritin-like protein (DUF455 family)
MALTSVSAAICSILETADIRAKIMATRRVARDWRLGRLRHGFEVEMPDRPARPPYPRLLPPNQMPSRRKGGSLNSRVAMIHAFAHIEFVAVDLALDMAGRFGAEKSRVFVDDWLGVAADEAMHFALLERRLRQLGSHYGALPAHDGLWEAAAETRHDVLARLAVVPMVLEARGLDVSPATISRFQAARDPASAAILGRIYRDEIRHVGVGARWFAGLCESAQFEPVDHWQVLVKRHFRGSLKPPFNDSARESAGLSREYYAPLALTSLSAQ